MSIVPDEAYPWLGQPRRFSAAAMPNGHARFGVEGALVLLTEARGEVSSKFGALPRQRMLSRGEAEALIAALQGAVRTFDLAARMVAGAAPRACGAPYPFRDHRTLADLGADAGADVGADAGADVERAGEGSA